MANAKRIETIGPGQVRALLGPAEGQYGALTLAMQGANLAAITCGSTVVDGSPEDANPSPNFVAVNFVWNDLPNETGYRFQVDFGSATFVTEDGSVEHAANVTSNNGTGTSPPSNVTGRILGHVGHPPGHGGTPIAGDVVSNECTVTFAVAS